MLRLGLLVAKFISIGDQRWIAGCLVCFVDYCFTTLGCLAFAIRSFMRPLMKDICTFLTMGAVVIEYFVSKIFFYGSWCIVNFMFLRFYPDISEQEGRYSLRS